MKELTRITTVEITTIEKFEDEEKIMDKEESKAEFEKCVKRAGADGVVVTNIQDFIREVQL